MTFFIQMLLQHIQLGIYLSWILLIFQNANFSKIFGSINFSFCCAFHYQILVSIVFPLFISISIPGYRSSCFTPEILYSFPVLSLLSSLFLYCTKYLGHAKGSNSKFSGNPYFVLNKIQMLYWNMLWKTILVWSHRT